MGSERKKSVGARAWTRSTPFMRQFSRKALKFGEPGKISSERLPGESSPFCHRQSHQEACDLTALLFGDESESAWARHVPGQLFLGISDAVGEALLVDAP